MESPRRILFVSKSEISPSTRYRALAYFDRLQGSGWEPCHLSAEGGLMAKLRILSAARESDVVVIIRKTFARPFLRLLAACAKHLVFDLDDAIFNSSSGSPSATRQKRFAVAAGSCDCVWAGNGFLSAASTEYNSRVSIFPTSVDCGQYSVDGVKPDDHVDLVWIGSGSTRKYLAAAVPFLEQATGAFPEARLKIIADFDLSAGRLETLAVPWSEAGEAAELSASHIGIAPMPDDPWTRGKCGLKVLQYMAAGLPVISSPSGVNATIVVHGETGFLAGSDREWKEAVETLVKSSELRRSMGMAGRRRVVEHYSTDATFAKMLDSLAEIAGGGKEASHRSDA